MALHRQKRRTSGRRQRRKVKDLEHFVREPEPRAGTNMSCPRCAKLISVTGNTFLCTACNYPQGYWKHGQASADLLDIHMGGR